MFGSTLYVQNNLVSDIPLLAANTDPNLVNPWGISASSSSPWWVSDNKTGLSTLYTGTGAIQGLVVTVPPPLGGTGPSSPTGQVFNSTGDFQLPNGNKAFFIFATEDGTISGWNAGTNAVLKATTPDAVYKGLALGSNGGGNFLYAANFHSGSIDVFDKNFAPATLTGNFADAAIPAGFAPFNIQNIGGQLYVTYAKQDADKHDDVAGPGNGFVDVFDTNGNFVKRLASDGALNSPWGLALAPGDFGSLSNDLLVGNFGDGAIHAYDPITGNPLGSVLGTNGNPIAIEGLWALGFGNGAGAGATNSLFFTAGIPGDGSVEDHGLFGNLQATPEPGAIWMLGGGLIGFAGLARRGKK